MCSGDDELLGCSRSERWYLKSVQLQDYAFWGAGINLRNPTAAEMNILRALFFYNTISRGRSWAITYGHPASLYSFKSSQSGLGMAIRDRKSAAALDLNFTRACPGCSVSPKTCPSPSQRLPWLLSKLYAQSSHSDYVVMSCIMHGGLFLQRGNWGHTCATVV